MGVRRPGRDCRFLVTRDALSWASHRSAPFPIQLPPVPSQYPQSPSIFRGRFQQDVALEHALLHQPSKGRFAVNIFQRRAVNRGGQGAAAALYLAHGLHVPGAADLVHSHHLWGHAAHQHHHTLVLRAAVQHVGAGA